MTPQPLSFGTRGKHIVCLSLLPFYFRQKRARYPLDKAGWVVRPICTRWRRKHWLLYHNQTRWCNPHAALVPLHLKKCRYLHEWNLLVVPRYQSCDRNHLLPESRDWLNDRFASVLMKARSGQINCFLTVTLFAHSRPWMVASSWQARV
jgi:hypothetical protein